MTYKFAQLTQTRNMWCRSTRHSLKQVRLYSGGKDSQNPDKLARNIVEGNGFKKPRRLDATGGNANAAPLDDRNNIETAKKAVAEMPEAPTTCCMSGCANCVWLEYADRLTEYLNDNGETVIKQLEEKVTDENIRAFIMHELRMRKK